MFQVFHTFYSTGEFAKICHTTKETLFHYDELGILKPQIVKDNGYRYYSSSQYFEFDLIKVLQETSMSLKDIKVFMEHRNENNFISLLKEKNIQLEKEKTKIEQMQLRIQNAIEMTQYGIQTVPMTPFIQEVASEHLLTMELDTYPTTDHEVMSYVSQHLEYCRQNHLGEDIPLGSIIKYKKILEHEYHEELYFAKLNKRMKDQRYVEKPKGIYATILHEGYYNTMDKSIDLLLKYIDKENYVVTGDCYAYEILSYFTKESTDNYLIQISIQVDKKTKIV